MCNISDFRLCGSYWQFFIELLETPHLPFFLLTKPTDSTVNAR